MRVWYKTLVAASSENVPPDLDRTFADHARGMGGYECAGYESKAEFFQTYFNSSTRLQYYDAFLSAHVPKSGRTLSIASGRGANEMRLVEQGYDIVCSDLEPVCPGPTRALFPGYKFMKWNALVDPLPEERFEAAFSLSFAYLLDAQTLDAFMERVGALLAPGGVFILDSAGSPDNALANFIHEVAVPLDARVECAVRNLRARLAGGERQVLWRKHQGYRYRDREYVTIAARHGLELDAVAHMDFENEWRRLFVYRYALRRIPPIKAALLRLGRRIPYVRMFAFRRAA